MNFIPLEIPEVVLIRPRVFSDARGYFFEAYNQELFSKNGIRDVFVQDNFSSSSKGTLRGFHYQLPPKAQAKLVRVVQGAALDIVVDIRKKSKTFGKTVSYLLKAESKEMLYVPAGFAHGFCALEDSTEFMYKVSEFYSPEHERGILWSDPDLNVQWPKMNYILSDKDKIFPRLKEAEIFS